MSSLGELTAACTCPVAAVLAYMSVRGSSPGPPFKCSNGTPLTRDRFVIRIKEALARAGAHSDHIVERAFSHQS